MKIRTATNADGEAIRRVVGTALAEFGFALDLGGTDGDLNDVESSYAGGAFDVLTNVGQVVGTVGVFPLGDGVCELRKMYLLREHRGGGLGKRLLHAALDRAREIGFRRVVLETVSVLRVAIELYESVGFRLFTPEQWHAGAGRADSAYYMDL